MTEDEALRLMCDERTLVANETAVPVKRGDRVWIDFKGHVRPERIAGSGFLTFYARWAGPAGEPGALLGREGKRSPSRSRPPIRRR